MTSENEGKVLQLAMAFGQGAGSLLADEAAAREAAAKIDGMLTKAFRNWQMAAPTAATLVRAAGQMAAQRALQRKSFTIEMQDIDWYEIEQICGCV